MSINAGRAVGSVFEPVEFRWDPARVALYHLGIGAGATGPRRDAELLLEDRLAPLPSFATLTSFPALIHLDQVPGLAAIDLARVLHAEHDLELAAPVPPAGSVSTSGCVEAVERKGTAALVRVRQESRRFDGSLAWTNRYAMFARGVGEFESPSPATGPPPLPPPPDRAPDLTLNLPTLPQQAAIYRHSGDDNPLHLDPAYARSGGFEAPILQGLCSLGFAVRGATASLPGLDPRALRRIAVRFTGAVTPGATLGVRLWREGDTVRFAVEDDGGAPVLGRGLLA
jgi:acyl dehydratase